MEDTSILIVEDEVMWQRMLERIVSLAGHRSVAVDSVDAAIRILSKQSINLVLLDLRLREWDGASGGMELLEWLANSNLAVKVIIVTAHGRIRDAREAFKHRELVVDLIPKADPETDCFQTLLTSLREALDT